MKHKANLMKMSTSKPNEVWYMDSGATNHMMNHEEWFSHLKKPKQPGVVETSDNTSHPIEHIRDVPLSCWPGRTCWGQGHQCGGKSNTLCDEELRMRESKRDTHRERDTHTKNITIFKKATVTKDNNNNLYKGYKVTLYND